MDETVIMRLKVALLEFVERASKPNATTEEVEALAAVASVLVGITIPF